MASPSRSPRAAIRLGELRIPVLVIVGDRDTNYILAAADYMVANVSDAGKVVMKETAHLPNLERPEEFNRRVREFLARV